MFEFYPLAVTPYAEFNYFCTYVLAVVPFLVGIKAVIRLINRS